MSQVGAGLDGDIPEVRRRRCHRWWGRLRRLTCARHEDGAEEPGHQVHQGGGVAHTRCGRVTRPSASRARTPFYELQRDRSNTLQPPCSWVYTVNRIESRGGAEPVDRCPPRDGVPCLRQVRGGGEVLRTCPRSATRSVRVALLPRVGEGRARSARRGRGAVCHNGGGGSRSPGSTVGPGRCSGSSSRHGVRQGRLSWYSARLAAIRCATSV